MRVLIFGVSGQDGSYLADHLVRSGHQVIGATRSNSRRAVENLQAIEHRLTYEAVDMRSEESVTTVIARWQPDEIYNFAGPSFDGGTSWDDPIEAIDQIGTAVTRILEAIRRVNPDIRFFQASSSELFGRARTSPQNENTPFHPRTPYGVAKLYGHWMVNAYRETHRLYAVSGILFNHESPRRRGHFLSRKISLAAARIRLGAQASLVLGDLDARRDWGFAGDFVRAAHLTMSQPEPRDYVIGTGQSHSVRDLLDLAFGFVDLDWRKYVTVDPQLLRDPEPFPLVAHPQRLLDIGWQPSVTFQQLVELMVAHDLRLLGEEGRNHTPALRMP